MQLTEEQLQIVCEKVLRIFGEKEAVRLFGSRPDDTARGGNIGFHIKVLGQSADLLDWGRQLLARLMRRLGERRIDVVVHGRGVPLCAIDTHARQMGISL